MDITLQNIVNTIKAELVNYVEPINLYLIGSNSTGITNNTDIDIAVIVPDSTNCYQLIKQLSQTIARIIVSYGIFINLSPIKAFSFENNSTEFIKNIKDFGIEIL